MLRVVSVDVKATLSDSSEVTFLRMICILSGFNGIVLDRLLEAVDNTLLLLFAVDEFCEYDT